MKFLVKIVDIEIFFLRKKSTIGLKSSQIKATVRIVTLKIALHYSKQFVLHYSVDIEKKSRVSYCQLGNTVCVAQTDHFCARATTKINDARYHGRR